MSEKNGSRKRMKGSAVFSTIRSRYQRPVGDSRERKTDRLPTRGGWTGSAANHIISARAGSWMSPSSSLA
jgi:hypothetical protein